MYRKIIVALVLSVVFILGGLFLCSSTRAEEVANAQTETVVIDQFSIDKQEVLESFSKTKTKYKKYMTKTQKSKWKKYIAKIKSANSQKTIDKYSKKLNKIVKELKKHKKFVKKWTKRIDKYLSGSPMAGCGKYYAEAAWVNDIDPKWAPAISCVESGKGRAYIHGTYNAWGWGCGSITLGSSWKSSIKNYVAKLKAGYGSNLTMWAAQKYCGSYWYSLVASEMSKI